jgi:adenylylsulfate kinase-like enzyme
VIVWFTGQPGSGKSTLAEAMVGYINVDGDDLRLLDNPGYGEEGRRRNVDRAQAIAAFLESKGFGVAVSLVAPYRDQRETFKTRHNVLEVFLHTADVRGREQYFVEGYEPPLTDFVDIDTGRMSIVEAVRIVHRSVATTPPRT